jgi:FdhD protein
VSALLEQNIRECQEALIQRFDGQRFVANQDMLAVEEPLEIRLAYGPAHARQLKSISVTMRTPGSDAELAAGFLMTEGVIRDEMDIVSISMALIEPFSEAEARSASNVVTVQLAPKVEVNLGTLQRNFYTTSSCGICGKASLLALRTVCPPRRMNEFVIDSETLCTLPARLREAQGIFNRTGWLHAAGLFSVTGELDTMREDVGRHNAVDKLIGAALLEDRVPLRDRLLLLSGRASFELLQKAVMGGVPMVASVGAPSSMAVEVARDFDVTLVGFLRDNHFNVYHGSSRIQARELGGYRNEAED